MVKCLGCPAIVYFDDNLHIKLLEDYAKSLGKEAKDLTANDLKHERVKDLGSGRPFDVGSDPPTVHQCPGFNRKEGKWAGRAYTTKNLFHGYKYNAYNIEQNKTNETNTVVEKPVVISPKSQDYANNNNKSKPVRITDKTVIVFSEQSILETQKQIIRDIEIISRRIDKLDITIDFIKYLLSDITQITTTDARRT